jgi:hypothetical protein
VVGPGWRCGGGKSAGGACGCSTTGGGIGCCAETGADQEISAADIVAATVIAAERMAKVMKSPLDIESRLSP